MRIQFLTIRVPHKSSLNIIVFVSDYHVAVITNASTLCHRQDIMVSFLTDILHWWIPNSFHYTSHAAHKCGMLTAGDMVPLLQRWKYINLSGERILFRARWQHVGLLYRLALNDSILKDRTVKAIPDVFYQFCIFWCNTWTGFSIFHLSFHYIYGFTWFLYFHLWKLLDSHFP